jgi:hypothetical protein
MGYDEVDYQAKKAIADPSRRVRSISRLSKEKIEVSALNAQFQPSMVMDLFFIVRHIHCVYAVHELAARQI